MKRFVIKTSIFALFCLAVSVLFPLMVDPYNVFHVKDIRDNGVEPNKHYIKMCHVLEDEVPFDAYLFGSSRVGALHSEKLEGVNCYNMTYSEGLPAEHLENIKTLLNAGKKVSTVYIGVDISSYTNSRDSHKSDPIRMPYEYIKAKPLDFARTYFDPAKALRALPTISGHTKSQDYAHIFYDLGWAIGENVENMAPDAYVESSVGDDPEWESEMKAELEAIAETKKICDENGIKLVVFTLPMHEVTYRESLKYGYKDFLKGLSDITPFYNFSGLNRVTMRTENYIDPSHFNAAVGDMIIEVLNGNAPDEKLYVKGFGWYVDKDNIAALLEVL